MLHMNGKMMRPRMETNGPAALTVTSIPKGPPETSWKIRKISGRREILRRLVVVAEGGVGEGGVREMLTCPGGGGGGGGGEFPVGL